MMHELLLLLLHWNDEHFLTNSTTQITETKPYAAYTVYFEKHERK